LRLCLRGSRQTLQRDELAVVPVPVLVAAGTRDDIAGSPAGLAALFPDGQALDIPNRDHMVAVGDRVFKAAVLEFLKNPPMRHLQPATAMFTGAAGNRLIAEVFGDAGPPVLLLHGRGQTRHAWGRTAEHLARAGATAYALDQRGHGDSAWVDGTTRSRISPPMLPPSPRP
jgi:pimeloyl-ACP methyl ester carboxylesterase